MKKLLLLLAFMPVFFAQAQVIPDSSKLNKSALSPWYLNNLRVDGSTQLYYNGNRPITGSVATGTNPGTRDLIGFLNAIFYPSQVPTATLTGGETRELIAAGADVSYTLNYSAGRQAYTEPLASIVVAGNTKTFTQPAAPGTVTGTQGVTVVRNTNTTFTNTVTTTDSKTASATTSVTWLPKFYYGFVPSATPSNSEVINMNGVFYSGGSYSNTVAAPVTAGRIAFAKPVSSGAFGSIIINTFLQPSDNYTITTQSITNASGYTQDYYVLVFTTSTGGGYSFTAN